jgi:hypothetical protein
MSTGGTVQNVYNIDARHAEIGVEERIAAVLASVEKQRPTPVDSVSRYRNRFPTRGI